MSVRGTRHLILVGLPGAGKSTLGPLVAAALALPFVDLDAEIIASVDGRSVASIFSEYGEQAFRRLEREATERLRYSPTSIVAPGGGWITQSDVVALVSPPSRIVHLGVTPATALSRMGNEVGDRPLLKGEDPLGALVSLESDRREAYARADAVLDTEALTLQELVSRTASLASSWGVGVG